MLTDYILIHQANGPILNLAYEHLAYDHKIQNSDILQFYESLKHHQFLYTLNIADLGIISPHVEMLRILATQFSAASGLTVTDTGVVNDANPTSSDAILAQSQTLVSMAEQLNEGNGDSLRLIGMMALAIANNTTLDELTDTQKSIVAHFKNPAMPSVAVTADAAIKIASARPEFAGTDTFLEMIGFDQADIRRIKAQEQRERGLQVLGELGE